MIQPYTRYGVFNGSILIAKGKEALYKKGFGYANKAKKTANTATTQFRLGSISKTFSALLIMQLVEENALSLTEPLHNILPEYTSPEGQNITVRHLLEHTSGLPGHFALPGWRDGLYQDDISRKKWLQIISQLPLSPEQDKQYLYSNLNYFLLGCVIEKLTGMSFQDNLQTRVFQPANMPNSGVELSGIQSRITTLGYEIGEKKGIQVQYPLNMQVFFAGANIYSTVVDLFHFEQALFSGKLISKKMLDFWMNKNQAFAWQSNQLDFGDKKPTQWLSTSGKLQGFSSILNILGSPEITFEETQERLTIIILSNNGTSYNDKQRLTLDLSSVFVTPTVNEAIEFQLPATFFLTKAAIEGRLIQQASYVQSHIDEFEVNERDINQFAQELFWSGATHKAIVVWELNTQLFPNSTTAYNKLKEACKEQNSVKNSLLICRKHGQINVSENGNKSTLIKNITIISPELSKPLEEHDVYIEGDTIMSIGKALKEKADQIINGTGLFLTPGLIDAHTHLLGVPGMTFEQTQSNPDIVKEAVKQIPRSYLYHGFTTVIDLHSDSQSIASWNQQLTRPKAYFCGAAPIVDGYPMNFIPKPLRYHITPYFLLDGQYLPKGIDPKQHTPKFVVEKMKFDGAICVKTHYESGFSGQNNLPTPSLELIQQLKLAANKAGLPLLLHANSQAAQDFGIKAEVDLFTHGMWTWDNNTQTRMNAGIYQILNSIITQNIAVQPTIQVLYGERDVFNPEYLDQMALTKVLPQTLIDWYKTPEGQGFRNRLSEFPYIQDALQQKSWKSISKQAIERAMKSFSYVAKKGGVLSFGSDTPSDLTFANPPGLNGRLEMKRWEKAGISPKQFLTAATITNAKLFNLQDSIGSVQVSKRADLLILRNNPLQSIDAFDSIETVISAGKVLPRLSLAANF